MIKIDNSNPEEIKIKLKLRSYFWYLWYKFEIWINTNTITEVVWNSKFRTKWLYNPYIAIIADDGNDTDDAKMPLEKIIAICDCLGLDPLEVLKKHEEMKRDANIPK